MPHEDLLPVMVKHLTKEQLWPVLEAISVDTHNNGQCPLCGCEDVPVDKDGIEIEGDDVSEADEWREVHEDDCPVTLIEKSFHTSDRK